MPPRRIKARIADQPERISRFRPKLNRWFALSWCSNEFEATLAQLRQRWLQRSILLRTRPRLPKRGCPSDDEVQRDEVGSVLIRNRNRRRVSQFALAWIEHELNGVSQGKRFSPQACQAKTCHLAIPLRLATKKFQQPFGKLMRAFRFYL